MAKTDRRDLSPPSALREAIVGLDIGGGSETLRTRRASGRVLTHRIDATIDVPGVRPRCRWHLVLEFGEHLDVLRREHVRPGRQ